MIAAVTYTHSFEQASEYARAALEMLARQQAPANPENFAVWYTYFSGADQDLKRAVDGLLGENEAVGEKGTVELYNRFIVGEQDDAAREAAHQIEEQLAAVYTVLEEAGDGAAEYGKTLETVSGQIARGEGVGEVREVIATLLAQTRDMAERTRTLRPLRNTACRENLVGGGNVGFVFSIRPAVFRLVFGRWADSGCHDVRTSARRRLMAMHRR